MFINHKNIKFKGETIMETMGRHVISELWGCDFEKLNNMDFIEKTFVEAL